MGIIEEIAHTWSLKTHGGFWSRFVYVCLCVYLYATNTNEMSVRGGFDRGVRVSVRGDAFTMIGRRWRRRGLQWDIRLGLNLCVIYCMFLFCW